MPSVLVVDDDLALRTMIAQLMSDEGWQVRGASDGADALAVLDTWLPDVLLVDLTMPRMDGRVFISEVTRMNRTANISIVVMSGRGAVHPTAVELGAAAAIEKPFEVRELVDTLAALVLK